MERHQESYRLSAVASANGGASSLRESSSPKAPAKDVSQPRPPFAADMRPPSQNTQQSSGSEDQIEDLGGYGGENNQDGTSLRYV
jgi:hypothetical protein